MKVTKCSIGISKYGKYESGNKEKRKKKSDKVRLTERYKCVIDVL